LNVKGCENKNNEKYYLVIVNSLAMEKCQYICKSTHKQCKRNASRELKGNKYVCQQHFYVILHESSDKQIIRPQKTCKIARDSRFKTKKSKKCGCHPETVKALQRLLGPFRTEINNK
jgi:hypothetical protein